MRNLLRLRFSAPDLKLPAAEVLAGCLKSETVDTTESARGGLSFFKSVHVVLQLFFVSDVPLLLDVGDFLFFVFGCGRATASSTTTTATAAAAAAATTTTILLAPLLQQQTTVARCLDEELSVMLRPMAEFRTSEGGASKRERPRA